MEIVLLFFGRWQEVCDLIFMSSSYIKFEKGTPLGSPKSKACTCIVNF